MICIIIIFCLYLGQSVLIMMLNKYFQEYDSEEDENYEPTAKENRLYDLEHQKKKGGKRNSNQTIQSLYEQMKRDYVDQERQKEKLTSQQKQKMEHVEMASKILNSQSIKPNKRIVFAGKQYILNEETGQLEAVERKAVVQSIQAHQSEIDQQAFGLRMRHISYQYLNHVMQAIYNRSKKINAIGKSKLDWKGFVKQEGIEDKLHYNRKGGVIQNMEFIRNTR